MQSLAACQRPGGAFLRTARGRVLSCQPSPSEPSASGGKAGKKEKGAVDKSGAASSPPASQPPQSTFDVQLDETVLFPEGGGQPTDTGVLSLGEREVPVLQVLRTPKGIVHRVAGELPVGAEVESRVDWTRRFDHMQCHSAQHLISAVARQAFGLKTVSWWLATAPQECHIELDGVLTPEQMAQLEEQVNEHIREGKEMKLHTYESLAEARADDFFARNMQKAIPDAHEGAVRVIEIAGVDFNPCCGTHLATTAQLQMVKLTRVEKAKASSKLFFLVGGRALQALSSALETARQLTGLLSVPQEGFVEKVRQWSAEARAVSKTLASVSAALAQADAQRLAAEVRAGEKVVAVHRDELGLNFLGEVADALAAALQSTGGAPGPYLLLASSGEAVGAQAGTFLLVGDEQAVAAMGAEVAAKLAGKGGGRKGRFQGKATKLDEAARKEAIECIRAKMA